MAPRPFFTVRDIARMWGAERAATLGHAQAAPLARDTVLSYLKHSKPDRPGRQPHRYANNPMPLPTYINDDGEPVGDGRDRRGQQPIWLPDEGETLDGLERRLRAWWHSRVGPGARTDLRDDL